jgi:hypothetical protein
VRLRPIAAFIVVSPLAALAPERVINLVLPAFPSLHVLVNPPKWALFMAAPGNALPWGSDTVIASASAAG